MMKIITVVTVFIVSVSVHSHERKRYNLTASDQLLIDMMQHYLHTSRKNECKVPNGSTGQVGGMKYNVQGGGVNMLCLPSDPENGPAYSYDNDALNGSEYRPVGTSNPPGFPVTLMNREVPCAVCRRRQVSSVVMIPGRKICYHGWNMEYNGYLMTEHNTHYRSEYNCVDMAAESLDDKNSYEQEAFFYLVRTRCGSLRCPPYKDKTAVYCVVCSK